MKNIPKKIYLQHGLSDEELKGVDFNDFNKHGSMSWCADQIEKNDICYVLKTQYKELVEENKRLKDDLKFRKSILSDRAQDL